MNNAGVIAALVVGGVVAFVIALNVGGTVVTEVNTVTGPSGALPSTATGPLALARTVVQFMPVLYYVALFGIPAGIGYVAYRKIAGGG